MTDPGVLAAEFRVVVADLDRLTAEFGVMVAELDRLTPEFGVATAEFNSATADMGVYGTLGGGKIAGVDRGLSSLGMTAIGCMIS